MDTEKVLARRESDAPSLDKISEIRNRYERTDKRLLTL